MELSRNGCIQILAVLKQQWSMKCQIEISQQVTLLIQWQSEMETDTKASHRSWQDSWDALCNARLCMPLGVQRNAGQRQLTMKDGIELQLSHPAMGMQTSQGPYINTEYMKVTYIQPNIHYKSLMCPNAAGTAIETGQYDLGGTGLKQWAMNHTRPVCVRLLDMNLKVSWSVFKEPSYVPIGTLLEDFWPSSATT